MSTSNGMTSSIPRWFGSPVSAFGRNTSCVPPTAPNTLIPVCREVMGSIRAASRFAPDELREPELDHAVERVQRDPAEERRERQPVERERTPREERDARDEEAEVEHELDHPLRPLRERLRRVERVEAGEIDEREREEEDECDRGGARQAGVAVLEPVPDEDDQEDGGEDVRERERAGELPLELVERDGDHRGEEEPIEQRLSESALTRAGAQ